jgi:hypothetical protein
MGGYYSPSADEGGSMRSSTDQGVSLTACISQITKAETYGKKLNAVSGIRARLEVGPATDMF